MEVNRIYSSLTSIANFEKLLDASDVFSLGMGQLFLLSCRYVVRAKAGKKQSSKDAGGRAAHSAGASLRRYNELALKKVFNIWWFNLFAIDLSNYLLLLFHE